jgi:excisionase family DNA binding protein
MTALDDLRHAAELLPAGASVTLTRETLLAVIGTGRDETTQVLRDELTVTDLAAQFQRSASTVRGWIEAGRFLGAYKLRGRDWRVPLAAVDAFRAHERGRRSQQTHDLGAWRRRSRTTTHTAYVRGATSADGSRERGDVEGSGGP